MEEGLGKTLSEDKEPSEGPIPLRTLGPGFQAQDSHAPGTVL